MTIRGTRFFPVWDAGLVLSLLLAGGVSVFGQSTLLEPLQPAPAEAALPPAEEVSNLLSRVEQELTAAAGDRTPQPLIDKLTQLRRLLEERRDLLATTESGASQLLESLPPIPVIGDRQPPYPLGLLDEFRRARNARERAIESHARLAEAAETELDFAEEQQRDREQALRALVDRKAEVPDFTLRRRELELDVRIARQRTAIRQAQLRKLRATTETLRADLEIPVGQIAVVAPRTEFTREEYESVQFTIDQREATLRRQVEQARLALQAGQASGATSPVALQRISTIQRELEALEERLDLVPESRTLWQRRFELYHAMQPRSVYREWAEEADRRQARLARHIRLLRLQQEEAAAAVRQRLDEDGNSDERALLESRVVDALGGAIAAQERIRDLNRFFREDYELHHGSVISPQEAWERARDILRSILNFEITAIDDRAVTVRKIAYAIILILIGLKLARLFSHSLFSRVLNKVKVEESVIPSISTLVFYLLAVLVLVSALGVAGIPLTLFALLGGALAIGIGFGSQAILNNFISGLILLVERPIRRGDMVDVGGTYGKVERVGLRCTQVRSFNNVDIMVPNSSFLETNVVNWTLTDDRVRGELFVGVAYGSPTSRVREILLEVAKEHPKSLPAPAPEVMFMDFGDNSLVFRLYIWVRMRSPSDRDRVLSDLRFLVDERFREEHIVIAFPQRDVHLNTLEPLEIRMVRGPDDPPHTPES